MKNFVRNIICTMLAVTMLCGSVAFAAQVPTTKIVGDVDQNGVLEILDALMIQQMLARLIEPFEEGLEPITDVNNDGTTNIGDVTDIQRKLANMPNNFYADHLYEGFEDGLRFEVSVPSGQCVIGEYVDFSVTDERNRDLYYSLYINGEQKCDRVSADTFAIRFSDVYRYEIKVEVSDDDGNMTTLEMEYFVVNEEMLAGYSVDEWESRVISMVNELRAEYGAAPLKQDKELTRIARIKAQDIIDNDYRGHISPVWGTPDEMLDAFGYSYTAMGENLAHTAYTPDAAYHVLANSHPHRENMLDPKYTKIGIGYIKDGGQWVQLLAK